MTTERGAEVWDLRHRLLIDVWVETNCRAYNCASIRSFDTSRHRIRVEWAGQETTWNEVSLAEWSQGERELRRTLCARFFTAPADPSLVPAACARLARN